MRFKKIIIGVLSLFSICSCAYAKPDNSTKTIIDCPNPSELLTRGAEFCKVQVPAINEEFEEDYQFEVVSILKECTFAPTEEKHQTNEEYIRYYLR